MLFQLNFIFQMLKQLAILLHILLLGTNLAISGLPIQILLTLGGGDMYAGTLGGEANHWMIKSASSVRMEQT